MITKDFNGVTKKSRTTNYGKADEPATTVSEEPSIEVVMYSISAATSRSRLQKNQNNLTKTNSIIMSN
jgi:hypothetical protein